MWIVVGPVKSPAQTSFHSLVSTTWPPVWTIVTGLRWLPQLLDCCVQRPLTSGDCAPWPQAISAPVVDGQTWMSR